MKKKILFLAISNIGLLSGSIILGATVDMQLVHYLAMVLLMIGGYTMALNFKSS